MQGLYHFEAKAFFVRRGWAASPVGWPPPHKIPTDSHFFTS